MNSDWSISRRAFLTNIAKVGGAGAAYAALDALGATALAIGEAHAYSGPPTVPAGIGKGKRVTIIGAGMAGLTSAYELSKAGFICTVLEARARPGGRNWTIRGGDLVEQNDGLQKVTWPKAPHLYFNAGPARIPHHHHALLGYCREFNVPLEIMMNDNRAALYQDDAVFGGKPVEAKQVIHDTNGHFGELLNKAMSSGGLDKELSKEDRERLREVLTVFGDLKADGRYLGSERAGYTEAPGAALKFGKIRDPLPLSELLKAELWQYKIAFNQGYEQTPTIMQPVGGMDQIPKAFAKRIGHLIRYETVVDEIRKTAVGAKVICHNSKGQKTSIESDFIICTMPLSVLRNVPNDLSPNYKKAIAEVRYDTPAKIAFYAPRRFWELDNDIYGGMSWTSRDITQILYPSQGIGQRDGVLVGAYSFGVFPEDDVSKVSVSERLRAAIISGERMHPGYQRMVRDGVSVAWPNVKYSEGGWASWTPEQKGDIYRTLQEPDGAIYFAGEHLSNLAAWQEGAILSAHFAVAKIAARVGS